MNIEENAAIMKFDVVSKSEISISISEQVSPHHQITILKDATAKYVKGDFGSYFIQEIRDRSWVISSQHFFIKKPIRLNVTADRPMVAIIFILKGNFSFDFTGHGKLLLQKNKYGFYYIPAGIQHKVDFIPDEYDAVCISIAATLLEEFAEQHQHFKELYDLQIQQDEHVKVLPIFEAGSEERKIVDAIRHCNLQGPASKIFMQARVYDLLISYFNAQNTAEKNGYPNTEQEVRLKEIQTFIQQNIHLQLSIRSLSRQAGMNLRSFERSFKKLFGTAPREYIEFQRINEAVELLKNTNMPVNTISMHVGFAGSNYFSFVFRKHYLCSPRQYRQQWLEGSHAS
jgi:AraC-like DNA-binding protein